MQTQKVRQSFQEYQPNTLNRTTNPQIQMHSLNTTRQERSLQQANRYFRDGNYEAAYEIYQKAILETPKLKSFLEYNIEITKRKINSSLVSQWNNIAVIFHAYHLDEINTCISYIRNIPFKYDLIVTTTPEKQIAVKQALTDHNLDHKLLPCENRGRDIGPFIKSYSAFKDYDLVCKIHTKKGDSEFSKQWKKLLYDSILASPEYIKELCNWILHNPMVSCAGSELLYGDIDALKGANEENLEKITNHLRINKKNKDSGFFMGSMFWFRPERFQFVESLLDLPLEEEVGINDGRIEHALERCIIGGSFLKNSLITLTRPQLNGEARFKNVFASQPGFATSFHKHFEDICKSLDSPSLGKIDISKTHITGWCASSQQLDCKRIALALDGIIFYEGNTNIKRNLPRSLNIKTASPGFSIRISQHLKIKDFSRSSSISLIDLNSGIEICKKGISSQNLRPEPITSFSLPQDAADLRAIHYLYNSITSLRDLNNIRKSKASIIMPTYNRCHEIVSAISSVLCQFHDNFELIIVDDGSTDSTQYLIERCFPDKRIIYKKITNQGVSKARNEGLKIASGDFIFFLDSDNSWPPDFIRNMIIYLSKTNLDNAFCYSSVYKDSSRISHYSGEVFDWDKFSKQNFIDLNCFCHRANNGLPIFFDESLKRLVDWDYIWRQISNKSIGFLPIVGPNYYDGCKERITNSESTTYRLLSELIQKIVLKNENLPGLTSNYYLQHRVPDVSENDSNPQADFPKKYDICTIILTYNHEKFIKHAIESAISQDIGSLRHHILILDDHSTDNTLEIAYDCARNYPEMITILPNDVNQGISKNLRKGLKIVNSDYVALLEGDDYWHSDRHLLDHYSVLQHKPKANCSFNKIRCYDCSTKKTFFLERQEKINKESLTFDDFMLDESWNLIANFSSTFWRSSILKNFPPELMEPRFNEIVTACYFSSIGLISYIDKDHTTYRIHSKGLWSGSNEKEKLQSGIDTRKTLLKIAPIKFSEKIKKHLNLMSKRLEKISLAD